jgi:hypothetical protein
MQILPLLRLAFLSLQRRRIHRSMAHQGLEQVLCHPNRAILHHLLQTLLHLPQKIRRNVRDLIS